MLEKTRRIIGTVAVSAVLIGGSAAPALAQVEQDGLVNVNIGDVTILENVQVAVAANLIANVCANVDANVALLAALTVDETGQDFTCRIARRGQGGQTATITQNIEDDA
jgi:hypothetical protein